LYKVGVRPLTPTVLRGIKMSNPELIEIYREQVKTIKIINRDTGDIKNKECKYCKFNNWFNFKESINDLNLKIIRNYCRINEIDEILINKLEPYIKDLNTRFSLLKKESYICSLEESYERDISFVLEGKCRKLEPEDIITTIEFRLPIHEFWYLDDKESGESKFYITTCIRGEYYFLPLPNRMADNQICFGDNIDIDEYTHKELYDIYWDSLFNLDGFNDIDSLEAILEKIFTKYEAYKSDESLTIEWEKLEDYTNTEEDDYDSEDEYKDEEE
jgi:hypothetical protein